MIKIFINADSRYPLIRKRIRKKVKTILGTKELEDLSLTIAFVGDRKMAALNKKFLGRNGTTDVLSFPWEEIKTKGPLFIEPKQMQFYLGDIVISYPQARKNAATHNRLLEEEIDDLVEHGILSLLGLKDSKQ